MKNILLSLGITTKANSNNDNENTMYVMPNSPGWENEYLNRLPQALQSAGYYIQKLFANEAGEIEFPKFRWLQTTLMDPSFQHLAFAYGQNVYSVLIELVKNDSNKIQNLVLDSDIENQLRECKRNDLVPCIIALNYDTLEPILKCVLTFTETGEEVVFQDNNAIKEMSLWEINNMGIGVVAKQIAKDGCQIRSICDVPDFSPQIWYYDREGKLCYVIVNTITGNFPESAHYKVNQNTINKFIDYKGFYAQIGFFPSDAVVYDRNGNIIPLSKRDSMTNPVEILYRGQSFYVNYTGLRELDNQKKF